MQSTLLLQEHPVFKGSRSRCPYDGDASIRYDDFMGQVVAYLTPQYQEFYGSRAAWDKLQEAVVKTLEAL